MKILITGGAGIVCSNLSKRVIENRDIDKTLKRAALFI